jgi:arylsulfatase A-like enzyme
MKTFKFMGGEVVQEIYPSARKTQYFEILAMRGIYHDGWMASTTPPFVPWAAFEGLPQKAPKDIINGYTWELYKLDDDPTQAEDLAAKHPDKLAEMKKVSQELKRLDEVVEDKEKALQGLLLVIPQPSP